METGLALCLCLLTKMAHLLCMASSMDDLIRDIFPVRKTIDDAVDEAESLSFRYQIKPK
jgi:hypothetical protein